MSDKCGSTNTASGNPCQREAGIGTDHPGEGYCYDHDLGPNDPPHSPNRLTIGLQESIAGMLERGQSITAACESHGLSKETYYRWKKWGEEDIEADRQSSCRDFVERMRSARGEGQRYLYDSMIDMAMEKSDWRAFWKVLLAQYPDDWGEGRTAEEVTRIIFQEYADDNESDTSTPERVDLDATD